MPSAELAKMPAGPTTTKRPAANVALSQARATAIFVCSVHSAPAGDVRIVPAFPTATNRALPKEMPFRLVVTPELRAVHETPSTDVLITPFAPTATNLPAAQVIPWSLLAAATTAWLQLVPSADARL